MTGLYDFVITQIKTKKNNKKLSNLINMITKSNNLIIRSWYIGISLAYNLVLISFLHKNI